MAHNDKVQLTAVIIAPPDQVEEGDRIFLGHAPWMESTHQRSGSKALLSYNLAKVPELSNPWDLNSAPTGRVCFILTEIYETRDGVTDHLERSSSWGDFGALAKWMEKCQVTFVPAAPIIHSLW